jgi:hypothetical protein
MSAVNTWVVETHMVGAHFEWRCQLIVVVHNSASATVDASCTQRCSWACEKHTQSYGHAAMAPTSHASHSYRCGHHDITYFHATEREWRNVGQAAHRVTRNTTLRQGACSENRSRGRAGNRGAPSATLVHRARACDSFPRVGHHIA